MHFESEKLAAIRNPVLKMTNNFSGPEGFPQIFHAAATQVRARMVNPTFKPLGTGHGRQGIQSYVYKILLY